MSRGRALIVGLRGVDPDEYQGWTGENGCWGCEADADAMGALLRPLGYDVTVLKTAAATSAAVLAQLRAAAAELARGDIFVFYFSGHGRQQPDLDGDEDDACDETIAMYDREIVDDELGAIWSTFRAGVRLVMVSDSCNSGTNFRAPDAASYVAAPLRAVAAAPDMQAEMIHLGGCRDGREASAFRNGGAFTLALCEVWASGGFSGSYVELFEQVKARIAAPGWNDQVPQYNEHGAVDDAFRRQRPFTI